MKIILDDLTHAAIAALLTEHLDDMRRHSPPESIHALALDGLRQANITLWSAWQGSDLLGCGALKALDPRHGEIKSMRTARAHKRKGVAAALLQHIILEAKNRGYHRLSLETGASSAFFPAHGLYHKYGFDFCEPFAEYTLDPHSRFMTKML